MENNDLKIIGIIPSRMASRRFPNKPLMDINGIPMIGHVYNRMKLCKDFSEVYVATCDQEIIDYIKGIGGKCIVTAESHIGCIDRTAEAVKKIEEIESTHYDVVVLVQSDEPMATPDMVGCAISPLVMDSNLQITSLMAEITEDDINEVDFDQLIAEAEKNGDYLMLCRLRYLLTLKAASDASLVTWRRYKTPTQYAQEWQDNEFGIMTNHFLRIRYGHYTAGAALAQEMRSLQETVLARINISVAQQEQVGSQQEGGEQS